MMLSHTSLKKTLRGASLQSEGVNVQQFRGIPYGRIARRFVKPEPLSETGPGSEDVLDCTKWGPRCPQVKVNISELLRAPKEEVHVQGDVLEEEDEFACLNLTVTAPAEASLRDLPVMVWIHGGSQTITFGSPSQRCGDPTRIVADSVRQGKPIIVVSMNYRVNVFAFGDNTPSSDVNLALEDQKLAIAWVRKHIRGFGGDEDNITLAGESAGAVYAHALMVLGTPVRRGILMSGSLFLSPPLPRERGQGLIDRFASVAKESGKAVSLQDAKVETLLDCVKKCKAVSMWLQMTDEFKGWSERMENVETLMVGDVEYESVIWRNGIETMTASEIDAAFSLVQNKDHREQLRNAYCIDVDHTTASKLGALDFINDTRFAMPSQDIAEKWRTAGRPVYQYIVDQANPWQASARSHHALDLVLLFGGYDISFNHHAEEVGKAMRSDWIEFINGTEPWDPKARMAFGPAGKSEQLQDIKHYASRRRMKQWDVLKRIDAGDVVKVFGALAAGKISFSN